MDPIPTKNTSKKDMPTEDIPTEEKLHNLIERYLIAKSNHRQKLLAVIYKLCKGYIDSRELQPILDTFIERFSKWSNPTPKIDTLIGLLHRLNKNFEAATACLNKAMDGRDSNAFFIMGYIHWKGLDGLMDQEEAKRCWIRGANLDNAFCLNSLGVLYMEEGNCDLACSLYFKAAILRSHHAKNNILEYMKGMEARNSPNSLFFKASSSKLSILVKVPSYSGFVEKSGKGLEIPFELNFPPAYSQLSLEYKQIFKIGLQAHAEYLYSEHWKNYHQEHDSTKQEALKSHFNETINEAMQNSLESIWSRYFAHHFVKKTSKARKADQDLSLTSYSPQMRPR